MPAVLLLVVVLLVPLLAGCMQSGARSDGVPTADAPFTLTALDVGQGDATLLTAATLTQICPRIAHNCWHSVEQNGTGGRFRGTLFWAA